MNEIQKLIFDRLDEMKIRYNVLHHPAVYTIEEMESLHINDMQQVVKSLFLRDDRKQRYFLVVLQKDKKADLKKLRLKLNSRPLSFVSEKELKTYLRLEKGSVTPFGILNDINRLVELVVDNDLVSFQYIGIHPNINTATVWLQLNDLEKIIQKHGNEIIHIEI